MDHAGLHIISITLVMKPKKILVEIILNQKENVHTRGMLIQTQATPEKMERKKMHPKDNKKQTYLFIIWDF